MQFRRTVVCGDFDVEFSKTITRNTVVSYFDIIASFDAVEAKQN